MPSFAVWCLGLSRACVLLLRSSWHSMSRLRSSWHSMSRLRSSWHSMSLHRRFPTSCSPRPRADPRVLFRTLHVLRVVWCDSAPLAPLSSARCACGGRCLQAGRELRHAVFVATLVRRWEHLVAGASASKVCTLRLSSGFALLCFPRSSTVVLFSPPGLVPEVIPCRRSARVCSEHLRVGRSWFVAMVWLSPLRPPGCSPAEAQSLRLFAAVAAAAVCLVVSGHSSTQTCSN